MKKIFTLLVALLLTANMFAQAPQKMSYQAVIRSSGGTLIASTTVGMQISILQISSTGTPVYVETQTPTSNANGLVSLEIGAGTIVTGIFSGIDWSAGPYFIKTETDPLGGTTYTISGTSELMSVPYALFSANGTPGPTGLSGVTGPTGADGATGAQGITGPTGVDGATGATGVQGNVGATGPTGTDGATGVQGNIGATGATGTQGIAGATGPTGVDGSLNAWSLTGSTGTVDGTNWIGTNDNVPLTIKVNGQKSGRIESVSTSGNTFFGYQSGNVNTGAYNTTNGYKALFSNTTGFNNVSNGYTALNTNTSGYANTANGYRALFSNTNGNYNTATGQAALDLNTTGVKNTADGAHSMGSNTTGSYNTTSGVESFFFNVAGNNATAIGYKAMYYANNQAGAFTSANVAVGFEALRGSTTPSANTGNNNSAIGYQTLWVNTTGPNNTALGVNALHWNTAGSHNSAMGTSALESNTSGNYNTASGGMALFLNTTGNNNTALGYGADVTSGSLTNATAIGYNAKVGASNSLILGGTGADAVNVGIGTTSPAYGLHVQKSGANIFAASIENQNATGWGLEVRTLDISSTRNALEVRTGGTSRFLVRNDGNVGIGITNPSVKLEVNGQVKITGGTPGVGKVLTSDGTGLATWQATAFPVTHYIGESYGGGIVFYVYDNGQHGLIASTADQSVGIQWYNGTNKYTGTSGDGLGAGTMNSTILVASQMVDNPTGNFAAKLCANYSVTVSGITYGDWYLPSIYELNLLFLQQAVVGGFANDPYWSSTENDNLTAWSQNLTTGTQYSFYGKGTPWYVRAIRSF